MLIRLREVLTYLPIRWIAIALLIGNALEIQARELTLVSRYPEEMLEYTCLASPYCAVVNRVKDRRSVDFYEREGDRWKLRHQKTMPITDDNQISYCVNNESLLVVLFSTNFDRYGLWVLDIHSSASQWFDYRLLTGGCPLRVRCKDRSVYVLAGNRTLHRLTFGEDCSPLSTKVFSYESEFFNIVDFDFLGEAMLYVAEPRISNSTECDAYAGVGLARFTDDELDLGDNRRWFYEIERDGENFTKKEPTYIDCDGSNVVMIRELDYGWRKELINIDWTNIDDPQFLQTVIEDATQLDLLQYKNGLLLFRGENPEDDDRYAQFMYQRRDSRLIFEYRFDDLLVRFSMGDGMLLSNSDEPIVYDVKNPSRPVAISPPVSGALYIRNRVVDGTNVYYIDEATDPPQLIGLNAGDLARVFECLRFPLEKGIFKLGVSHSVLSVYNEYTGKMRSFALNGDGSVKREIDTSALREEPLLKCYNLPIVSEGYYAQYYSRWKEEIFGQNEHVLRFHRFENACIGDFLGELLFDEYVPIYDPLFFIGDCFLVKKIIVTYLSHLFSEYECSILFYSMSAPDAPHLFLELPLIDREGKLGARQIVYNPDLQLLLYLTPFSTGVVDVSDPHHPVVGLNDPVHIADTAPCVGNVLMLRKRDDYTARTIFTFYRLDRDGRAYESFSTDRFYAIDASYPVCLTQNGVFSCHPKLGWEFYRLPFSLSSITDWTHY